MTNTGALKGVHLTERTIPVPNSISPQAQAALAMVRPVEEPFPAIDDKPGWYARIEQMNTGMLAMMRAPLTALPVKSETVTVSDVTVYIAEPETIPAENRDKVLLFFHGGGLVLLGGEPTRLIARLEAWENRCKVYCVDYRTPPDHPYPAAVDDCVGVYRELMKTYTPAQIVIAGSSGGGNLAAAVPLKIRDLGLPLPSAVGLFTPEVDLTESGDTFQTNRDIDVILRVGLPEMNQLYANGADLADPYLSPIFADFTKGFPPTFIQTGTRDLFLSNSARIHRALRKAGIETELHVWEGMPHGGFGGAPEDRELRIEFGHFLAKYAGWAKPPA
jgi:monoterpene epsilon-lactone hydrolase